MRHSNLQDAFKKYRDLTDGQEQGIKLGLSHSQVVTPNFGDHTVLAIRAEMEKGALLKDAFEKYRDLKSIEINAMTELGLSRSQVETPNFSSHTALAIRAEMEKGALLKDAFEKYRDLKSIEINAMTELGLSRSQVVTPNFGDHTVLAIRAEMEKGALLQDAFEKYRDLKSIEINAMTELGLSRSQVVTPNFGDHTVLAIRAEMEKGALLQDAFEKYRDLKSIEINAMTELGLSRSQVETPNFSSPTALAIRAEMEKGALLKDAFEKYRDLKSIEINAMTELGLSRSQVVTPNFGDHTVLAIKDIQKRKEELSSVDAFEMVKGKSIRDTKAFVETYLEATKNTNKTISEMDLIRVVVNTGRGFGHQRAAITLMQKLREMGFTGTFDIQCDDRLGVNLMNTKTGSRYRNEEPLVSRQLRGMIPGFESSRPTREGVRNVAGLGLVKISSFPHLDASRGNIGLPEADLAVCAADDSAIENKDKKAEIFNAASYIGLQPTDWVRGGSCFVTDQDGVVRGLPPASRMRLSSMASYQLPDISSIPLLETERRIVDITGNTGINSQLVYGLYPERHRDIESGGMKESGNLDEVTEMQRIVDANLLLSQKIGKPSVLLLPQSIALDADFIRTVTGRSDHINFVDLTKGDLDIGKYKTGDVVVAYTGCLQQTVFDYLMLRGTTFPPVIEGCNSRETCESVGRHFIHGSGKNDHLRQYEVLAVNKQEIHTKASLCLEQGNSEYVSKLVQYMEESLNSNPTLLEYHAQRKEAFLSRPDACEVAFDTLGISYLSDSAVGLLDEEERDGRPSTLAGARSVRLKKKSELPAEEPLVTAPGLEARIIIEDYFKCVPSAIK